MWHVVLTSGYGHLNATKHLCIFLAGVDEIIFNPEAIFSFYTAVGGLQATDEMDTQVRAKLVAVLNSPTTKVLRATYDNAEVWEGFVGVCDRLVDHLTSIRSWSPKTSDAGGREYFA